MFLCGMNAMILRRTATPLELVVRDVPEPGPREVLLHVTACAVCRTDLHVVDGDLPGAKPDLVPGHEIVGTVVAPGAEVHDLAIGDRVGVPWLGWTCGTCSFCRSGLENLCDLARFTGYHLDGGYADYTLADHRYCLSIPAAYNDEQAAPLLCAGLIGYRSLRMTGDAHSIGFFGFGAAAHIITQIAVHEGREVFAFTRPGDSPGQSFALSLGAKWAGSSTTEPPEPLDAAILFAPVGALVPVALRAVRKGGIVICAGIHMSDIPSFPYSLLWGERMLRSVANLTRQDGREFMALAQRIAIRTHVQRFPLESANEALRVLREGRIEGAAVLVPEIANRAR